MFAIDVGGLEGLSARLGAYPAALSGALAAKVAELAEALAERVRNDKLAGGVLNARTGALAASIAAEVAFDGEAISATVGSFGDVKYAAIQEAGGKTGAHEILPVKAKALAFAVGGKLVFARKVEHPGSALPARSYLGSALEEMSGEIVGSLTAVRVEAWEQV